MLIAHFSDHFAIFPLYTLGDPPVFSRGKNAKYGLWIYRDRKTWANARMQIVSARNAHIIANFYRFLSGKMICQTTLLLRFSIEMDSRVSIVLALSIT